MSIQEKRAIVSIITSIVITMAYTAFMMQRYPTSDLYSPEILRFWGSFVLILIPVSIVAKIIVYIAFSVYYTITAPGEEPQITDERDKLIELKATRNSMYVFVFGFLVGMGALAAGLPPAVTFSCLLCGGLVSEMVTELSNFYYYRRGF